MRRFALWRNGDRCELSGYSVRLQEGVYSLLHLTDQERFSAKRAWKGHDGQQHGAGIDRRADGGFRCSTHVNRIHLPDQSERALATAGSILCDRLPARRTLITKYRTDATRTDVSFSINFHLPKFRSPRPEHAVRSSWVTAMFRSSLLVQRFCDGWLAASKAGFRLPSDARA